METKQTYAQAMASQRNLAKARQVKHENEKARNARTLDDQQRDEFHRTFATALLEKRAASRYTPKHDKQSCRRVLAERGEA